MDTPISRRSLLASGLAAGFALAASPIAATALTTPEEGLRTDLLDIPVEGGTMPAYSARPAGLAQPPVLLVIQEIFGVHEHIRDVCRRYARQGYWAIAPSLFMRQGDPTAIADISQLMAEIVNRVPDADVLRDLDDTLKWARQHGAHPTRCASVGYCWGGRMAWLYAAHNPNLSAAVAYYGRLVGEASALRPRHPKDLAATLRVPVLGLYAGQDKGIPLDTVEAMQQALLQSPSDSQIVVFPAVAHGFNADYRPSYNARAAQHAAQWAAAWLAEHC